MRTTMTTNPDPLDRAEFLLNSAHGIHIPQLFAYQIHRNLVEGVDDKAWAALEAGPDHEWYWETWDTVQNNARVNHPTLGPCYLWQDEDLWLVPHDAA